MEITLKVSYCSKIELDRSFQFWRGNVVRSLIFGYKQHNKNVAESVDKQLHNITYFLEQSFSYKNNFRPTGFPDNP